MKQEKPCPKVQLLWIQKISSKRDCFHRIFCWKATLSSYQMNSRPTILWGQAVQNPCQEQGNWWNRGRRYTTHAYFRSSQWSTDLDAAWELLRGNRVHNASEYREAAEKHPINTELLRAQHQGEAAKILCTGKTLEVVDFLTVSSLVLRRMSLWKASSTSNVFRCLLKSNHPTQPCSHGVEFIFSNPTKATNMYQSYQQICSDIWIKFYNMKHKVVYNNCLEDFLYLKSRWMASWAQHRRTI